VLGAALPVTALLLVLWLASGDGPLGLNVLTARVHLRAAQVLPLVATLAGAHYVLAALALRSAAGAPLRLRETTLVQFAATAANRLTPAGLGGAVVNVRFLARRGLTRARAIGAVACLGGLGAVADVLLLVIVLLVGKWVGIAGGTHELSALASGVGRLVSRLAHLPRPVLAVAVLAALAVAAAVRRLLRPRRRNRDHAGHGHDGGVSTSIADAARHAAALARRPRDLALLLAASAGTTFVLGMAYALCAIAVAGVGHSMGALLVAYLVGAGAAAAVPVPAGMGSTEAALTAALVTARIQPADAIQAVLLFRAITFWAPVPVGAVGARVLRRRRAI
jgi:uncharacterized membrane protein YbhN (UPF0104 family)